MCKGSRYAMHILWLYLYACLDFQFKLVSQKVSMLVLLIKGGYLRFSLFFIQSPLCEGVRGFDSPVSLSLPLPSLSQTPSLFLLYLPYLFLHLCPSLYTCMHVEYVSDMSTMQLWLLYNKQENSQIKTSEHPQTSVTHKRHTSKRYCVSSKHMGGGLAPHVLAWQSTGVAALPLWRSQNSLKSSE